jgi:hypothetical protein
MNVGHLLNLTLADRTDPKFKHMLGKKVQFVCKGETHSGILEFAGVNDIVHHTFQVTVSRTPFWPVDPNSVKVL